MELFEKTTIADVRRPGWAGLAAPSPVNPVAAVASKSQL